MEKENITTINIADLGTENWSAEYHLNKKLGLDPYFISNYVVTPVTKPFQLKNATYLSKEDAITLTNLGKGIRDLIEKFNELKNK